MIATKHNSIFHNIKYVDQLYKRFKKTGTKSSELLAELYKQEKSHKRNIYCNKYLCQHM